jgi:hypothetical protein
MWVSPVSWMLVGKLLGCGATCGVSTATCRLLGEAGAAFVGVIVLGPFVAVATVAGTGVFDLGRVEVEDGWPVMKVDCAAGAGEPACLTFANGESNSETGRGVGASKGCGCRAATSA